MSSLPSSVLSIDISKDHLDTDAWPRPWRRRLGNDAAGIGAIVEQARQRGAFVVFEATSVYDRALRLALEAAGLAYHRANPRKARAFARSCGFLAKTDQVDAAMLAEYGRSLALPAAEPVSAEREALRALIDRRDQLVGMRKQEATRLQQTQVPVVRAEIESHLLELAARIEVYEGQIRAHLKAHDELAKAASRLASAPGIGLITASSLLALLPELGRRTGKTIAALVGVAPLAHDSGKRRGQRRIWGGRRRVRALLFLAARHAEKNPAFSAFADRLRHDGKPLKKIRIAVARKLLLVLNAMMAEARPFRAQPL
jgi:transposase